MGDQPDRDDLPVTAAMIAAGVEALRDHWGYDVPSREAEVVSAIFTAMVEAAPSTSDPAKR